MKKQILFVDDERNVLDGIQRALRPQRNEWDVYFVLSGLEALEILAEKPMDLIVADMRMSGMNGAELLAETMKRYPSVIRMVLSGHADADLIMKSVGVAHQFIAKPCEVEVLRSAIQRALKVGLGLKDENLKILLSRIGSLPSLPARYIEMANELQNPETSIQRVGEITASDPAMTAKILQLANSAFFGLRRRVNSAIEAVTYLGMDRVRHLFLAVQAFSQFEPSQGSVFSIDLLWEHSLSTAALAKTIATTEGAIKEVVDAAYTAGLLHDIGELILASKLSELHVGAVDLAVSKMMPLWIAEQAILSATHAEVGAYLLGLWNLPEAVVDAAKYHHNPSLSQTEGFCALTALHAADCQIANRCYAGVPDPQPDLEYLSKHLKRTTIASPSAAESC
jgi:putative nucleotidyltransferase with HDIG domain